MKDFVTIMIHKFIDKAKTQYWVSDIANYVNKKLNLNLPYHQVLKIMK